MHYQDRILIIIAFCIGIVIFFCYRLYSTYEYFASKIGTGSVDMVAGSGLYYCNFANGGWKFTQDKNASLKFNVYDDGTLTPIPNNSPTSCYQKDIGNNFKYAMPSTNDFSYGNYGKRGAALILDSSPSTMPAPTTIAAPTTTQAPATTRAAPTTTQAPTTQIPNTTRAPITTLATTTTQAPTTMPLTTIPYNTQYLSTIQNQIDNGYSMLNNNRFTIMDNQLKLDSLNSRVNKLLDNINKINNISNLDKSQNNNLTFY